MRVLVVNAGSSSLKLRLLDSEDRVVAGRDLGAPDDTLGDALERFLGDAGPAEVVGHRVVHGGDRFRSPVLVDEAVRAELDELVDLAPLHNPPALAGIDALRRALPEVPSVACFDTAFHASLPAPAATYALPDGWAGRFGVRRYGFHGLSCAWAASRAAELLGWPAGTGRLVVCHLGSGASLTAVRDGRSVDTTMGFTPLEGLVMATRCGDVDPGALLWLLARGVGRDEMDEALERRSGMAGLTGVPHGDLREVLARRDGGDERATLAVAVYLHRLRAKVAAMAAAMSGVDALVFTGAIGERSPVVRAEACAGLGWMGVTLDEAANAVHHEGDAVIGAPGATVRSVVVAAREDLVIASECRALLARGA